MQMKLEGLFYIGDTAVTVDVSGPQAKIRDLGPEAPPPWAISTPEYLW